MRARTFTHIASIGFRVGGQGNPRSLRYARLLVIVPGNRKSEQ